jgi:glutamate formiminotransferase/formiminotetrahydrofolate cyclodeaminase
MHPLIECVPNFSEGNDPSIIQQITDEIEKIEGVRLLNVDPGKATNRTVVTFVGHPEAVIQAAFRAIKKAGELIDMSRHKGEHPRMGATDVCPLIPIANITMEETADYARKLAKMVGEELKIPVYLYEAAQPDKRRNNLSVIRAGEYEGFFKKITLPEWKPDFGPAVFDAKRGGTVIGARDFLVAYNVNLNTTSVRRANAIAFDVREAGRKIKNEQGEEIVQPGSLKAVKAIGLVYRGIRYSRRYRSILRISILHPFTSHLTKYAGRQMREGSGSREANWSVLSRSKLCWTRENIF